MKCLGCLECEWPSWPSGPCAHVASQCDHVPMCPNQASLATRKCGEHVKGKRWPKRCPFCHLMHQRRMIKDRNARAKIAKATKEDVPTKPEADPAQEQEQEHFRGASALFVLRTRRRRRRSSSSSSSKSRRRRRSRRSRRRRSSSRRSSSRRSRRRSSRRSSSSGRKEGRPYPDSGLALQQAVGDPSHAVDRHLSDRQTAMKGSVSDNLVDRLQRKALAFNAAEALETQWKALSHAPRRREAAACPRHRRLF